MATPFKGQFSDNPNGIVTCSPGMPVAGYPGTSERSESTPTGVWPIGSSEGPTTPLGLALTAKFPKAGQQTGLPWAINWNDVAVRGAALLFG